uniref:L1 transposable element RRM domain-containing protein n=1 Tax=Sarcophilus harrisii TaxID=9305 RepID=A0A7N4PI92_SARHA
MNKKMKRTIDSFYAEKEQVSKPEETSNSKNASDCPPLHDALIEETIKSLKRELEDKWGKEREALQESNNFLKYELEKVKKSQESKNCELEKIKNSLESRICELEKTKNSQESRIRELEKTKNTQESRICELEKENNSLKKKISEMEKNSTDQNNTFKNSIGHIQKEVKKANEENNSLKIRTEQIETNDSLRQQESVKQKQKNDKLEKTMNYLLAKTTDLENRSRRDNLRIIGLSENYDEKKSLDTILQEIIKENCPDVIESEGKIGIERIHRTPSERNPKIKTPRNIVAKFQNYQIKEKILQAAKKKPFKYRGATIRITQDLAASTLKERRAWNMIFRKAQELGMQPRINYPAKLSIFFQGRRWTFNETNEFHLFLKKKPELNKKFDLQE